jgi:hypothetical protein
MATEGAFYKEIKWRVDFSLQNVLPGEITRH